MRLGWAELLVILVIVLAIFGGGKLAGVGSALGRTIREFKKEVKDDNATPASEEEKTTSAE